MTWKLAVLNLIVLGAYVFLIISNSGGAGRGFNIAIGIGACIVFQVLINVILGIGAFILNKREPGRSFLICAGILVLVGIVVWLVLLSIYGGGNGPL